MVPVNEVTVIFPFVFTGPKELKNCALLPNRLKESFRPPLSLSKWEKMTHGNAWPPLSKSMAIPPLAKVTEGTMTPKTRCFKRLSFEKLFLKYKFWKR